MKKSLKLFTLALTLMFAITVKVNAEECTDDCAAKVGTQKYSSITEAIQAVEDGGTVELLPGEFSEAVVPGRLNKSFTIIGAINHGTTLTGGMRLGTDVSSWPTIEATVTVKGIVFKNKNLSVADIRNVNIEDNKLENIETTAPAAIVVVDSAIDATGSNIVIKNNQINVAEQGIRVRTGYNIEITGNIVKNTNHNAVLLEHGAWPGNEGTVVIKDNTFENWALGGEGRCIRAAFGPATQLEKEISFTGNKMIRDTEPIEEYAKFTTVGTEAVNFEKNYWNSDNPDFDTIILVEGGNEEVKIDEYYKEETMEEEDLNTYVAPSGTDEENPKTGDSIMIYMILCLIGFIGTVLATNKLRKAY